VIEDKDLGGGANRRKTVGDDENGLADHEFLERVEIHRLFSEALP